MAFDTGVPMRELFDQLKQEGEAGILRLIDDRTQEGVQLDFKQKGDPQRGGFDNNDKKILAKAVSGFANSAGGLLIWGVNAEKGIDQVDCAQAPPAPISQIENFMSEATTLVGQLIQPRHDGIYLHVVPSSLRPDSGYLLIYVERSDRRPHRSEASGQKQYFKRAGDSFFEMEHYDIEDAFARTSVPKIEIMLSLGNEDDYYDRLDKTVFVHLRNVSDTMARFPFVNIWDFDPALLKDSGVADGKHGLRLFRIQRTLQFLGGADDVVHAQSQMMIAAFNVRVHRRNGIWMYGREPAIDAGFKFSYRIGCENMRSVTDKVNYRLRKFMPAHVIEAPPEPGALV
ncbi:helix-turn-helix domain-containing protein [Methylorubrum sp. DB1722]|uniref:AlbA family DNA-binding domain-containing protein n=1 Tax=Methylorubrum sp. DB1722 TaxID=2478916 RepID=UPI0018E2C69B|nr:ATP-binding protein [Methylorubrum sp. DB1722]